MSAPPYMRFYWGDYFRDTRRLNRLEHSAYLLILGEMWVHGGSLPPDDDTLARIALCTPAEWAEVKGAVLPFFRVVRGKLTQKRLAEEMSKYDDTVRKRKAAGKIGGSSRRGKDRENPEANAQANASQKDGISRHNQNQNHIEETPIVPAGDDPPDKPIVVRASDIEAIWALTPSESRRRSGKADLERALKAAAKRGHPPETVRAGLAAYFASPEATKDGGQFVKGVHRMVEGDRWEAFVEPPTPEARPSDELVRKSWEFRMSRWAQGAWDEERWGPKPGEPKCQVPVDLLPPPADLLNFPTRATA